MLISISCTLLGPVLWRLNVELLQSLVVTMSHRHDMLETRILSRPKPGRIISRSSLRTDSSFGLFRGRFVLSSATVSMDLEFQRFAVDRLKESLLRNGGSRHILNHRVMRGNLGSPFAQPVQLSWHLPQMLVNRTVDYRKNSCVVKSSSGRSRPTQESVLRSWGEILSSRPKSRTVQSTEIRLLCRSLTWSKLLDLPSRWRQTNPSLKITWSIASRCLGSQQE